MKTKLKKVFALSLISLILITMSLTAVAMDTRDNNSEPQKIFNKYEENEGNGLLIATNPTVKKSETNTDKKELEETLKVYEEHEGNGLLISAPEEIPEPDPNDEEIQKIFDKYEENEGNGLLISPNPMADEEEKEAEVKKEPETKKGFFERIGDFFSNLIKAIFDSK